MHRAGLFFISSNCSSSACTFTVKKLTFPSLSLPIGVVRVGGKGGHGPNEGGKLAKRGSTEQSKQEKQHGCQDLRKILETIWNLLA